MSANRKVSIDCFGHWLDGKEITLASKADADLKQGDLLLIYDRGLHEEFKITKQEKHPDTTIYFLVGLYPGRKVAEEDHRMLKISSDGSSATFYNIWKGKALLVATDLICR